MTHRLGRDGEYVLKYFLVDKAKKHNGIDLRMNHQKASVEVAVSVKQSRYRENKPALNLDSIRGCSCAHN